MMPYDQPLSGSFHQLYGTCHLCRAIDEDGPDVQIIECTQCQVPLAVLRAHVELEDVTDELRNEAMRALLIMAEEKQLSGMFDDAIEASSMTHHYRAHWRPLRSTIRQFPQELADAMAKATQEAVQWFHDRDHVFMGDPGVRSIPGAEVAERLAGMQYAMDKEVYQTVAHAGHMEDIIDPETMEGYDEFLRWHEEEHRPNEVRKAVEEDPIRFGYPVLRYDLSAMPPERQRALVERWERLHLNHLAAHPGMEYRPELGYLTMPFRIYGPPEAGEEPQPWPGFST